jgi:hypothetical protein
MLRVYPAGKISDDTPEREKANIDRLKRLTEQIILLGHSPFPTAYTGDWAETVGLMAENYYDLDLKWLDVSDVMVVVPERRETSVGVQLELNRAAKNGTPVCIGIEAFKEWLRGRDPV